MYISKSDVTMTSSNRYAISESRSYNRNVTMRPSSIIGTSNLMFKDLVSNYTKDGLLESDSDLSKSSDKASNVQKVQGAELSDYNTKSQYAILCYIMRIIIFKNMGMSTQADNLLDYANNYLSNSASYYETVQSSYSYEETQSTSFNATGYVQTSDGKSIEFNLNLNMSRSFSMQYDTVAISQRFLSDPLVLNLDNCPDVISDQTFYFDIDCDGQKDELQNIAYGNGFLALDKNENGIIDDGSELFGAQSGNGFMDLASYDEDNNGWIDEADSIYSKLKIYAPDADGNMQLYTLKDKDIGALCLQNAATDFTVKDANNITNGIIRSSGVYLHENGQVGLMQQVDLAHV